MTDSLEGKDSRAALFHKAHELDSSEAHAVSSEARLTRKVSYFRLVFRVFPAGNGMKVGLNMPLLAIYR